MLYQIICPSCGAKNLEKINDTQYECKHCDNVYSTEKIENYADKLSKLFDSAKLDMVSNAKKNLYSAVTAKYIGKDEVTKWCDEVKKYLPDDFQANFYYDFINSKKSDVAKNIRKIDEQKQFEFLEPLIAFVMKSLEKSYVTATKGLIERAYKFCDTDKYVKYTTMVEDEAEKLDKCVYDTKLPRKAFVAYSSKDSDKAIELVEMLEAQGITCFISLRNLRHGVGSQENYEKSLKDAMDHCMSFIFVSSLNSRNIECDAYDKEMPYIIEKDVDNAPGQYRNFYSKIPKEYKKPRVEYRIQDSIEENFADYLVDEFFDGYERAYTIKDVALRIMEQSRRTNLTSAKSVEAPKAQNNAFDALIKRIYLLLEDGEFDKADEICEQVLNGDPENAEAYICKILIEFNCRTKDELSSVKQSITNSKNYSKIIRFGNDEQIAYVKSANDKIQVVLQKIREEEERKRAEERRKAEELKRKQEEERKKAEELNRQRLERRKAEKLKRQQEEERIKAEELKRKQAEELKRKQEEERKRSEELKRKQEEERQKAEELKRKQEEAAKRESSAGLEFLLNKDGKSYTLTKVGRCTEAHIVIDMHKGLPVTSIGKSAFYSCSNLTSITIPNSVTSIGDYAFSKCSNLTSITIPNSVTSIGDWAFSCCSNLTSITIPNSVTNIGKDAFSWCSNLKSITIPNSVTRIDEAAFCGCENLTSITIPNSVTSIGDSAFGKCSNLTSITIPNSVTSIGKSAFYECTNLTSITIPNSVTSIDDSAFSYCTNLTSITIPNSVTSIGHSAFRGCTNLTSITIPNSITSIGNCAFEKCTNLTSITIPNSVMSIGDWAFQYCSNLTSITIPNSASIGNYAFRLCSNLTSIYCFNNWDNIVGIKNADIPKKAKIFHYSETKPSLKLFKRYWHYVDGVPTEW